MINAVLPDINPDYVSYNYSSWDSLWPSITALPGALTYIQTHNNTLADAPTRPLLSNLF